LKHGSPFCGFTSGQMLLVGAGGGDSSSGSVLSEGEHGSRKLEGKSPGQENMGIANAHPSERQL
jgi:hypothetical protein